MELVYFIFSGAAGGAFLFFSSFLFRLTASFGYYSYVYFFPSYSCFSCLHLFETLSLLSLFFIIVSLPFFLL